jgi:hypothetical protein
MGRFAFIDDTRSALHEIRMIRRIVAARNEPAVSVIVPKFRGAVIAVVIVLSIVS